MVVKHNRRSTWRHPVRELRDALLRGHCGDTTELGESEPTINIPPHLSRHPNRIREKDQFEHEEPRRKVTRDDTTWRWECMQLRGSRWDENEIISIYPGVSRRCTPRRSVHLYYPCISVHPPSVIHDVLGGRNRASGAMHLGAEIKWSQRCTRRQGSSELRDILWNRDPASLEMHLEAEIEWSQKCSWRP